MSIAASSQLRSLWSSFVGHWRFWLVLAGLGLAAATLAVLATAGGLFMPAPEPSPTIDGPEDPSLLAEVQGTVLHQVGQELTITPLQSRESLVIQHDRAWFVSGPDDRGRYVYVTNGLILHRHALHVASLVDGSDRVIFERRGHTGWHDTIRFVELAPSGGHLAVATQPYDPRDEFEPKTPRSLEIWDLDDGEHRELPAEGIVSASWFPDGRRLAIEAWLDPAGLPSIEPMPDPIRELHVPAERRHLRPAVFILDTTTNARSWLGWGSTPRVSPDGARILVELDDDEWRMIDLPSRSSSPVSLPGAIAYPRAWMIEDVLLYPASPTTGVDPGYTRAPGFAPTPNWTLKAARPGSKEFVTVVPCVRPYEVYSFGAFAGPR